MWSIRNGYLVRPSGGGVADRRLEIAGTKDVKMEIVPELDLRKCEMFNEESLMFIQYGRRPGINPDIAVH